MSTTTQSRWRSPLLPAFALPLVVVPACILLHELGHGAAMLALGFTDIGPLSASSIGQGVPPPDLPKWGSALILASGPTVTLLASAVGLALAAAGRWVPLSLSLLFAPTVEPVVDPILGPEGAEHGGRPP